MIVYCFVTNLLCVLLDEWDPESLRESADAEPGMQVPKDCVVICQEY